MMPKTKKAAAPTKETSGLSESHAGKSIRRAGLSPRLQRLILALLSSSRTVRELIDLLPANNPGEYVRQARNRFALEIPCAEVRFTTIDGKSSNYGVYSLTDDDRTKVLKMIDEVRG